MQVKWKTLFGKSIVWLAAEICLNFLGLDNLADYSEFLNLSFVFRQWSLELATDASFPVNTKPGEQEPWKFAIA